MTSDSVTSAFLPHHLKNIIFNYIINFKKKLNLFFI
jgi:hypothetical protein